MKPNRAQALRALPICVVMAGALLVVPAEGNRLERQLTGAARVLIRTEHAPVVIGGERYRIVTPRAPLVAAVHKRPGRTPQQIVVYVVRLGTADEPAEGATPLLVSVGGKQHIFPNRPRLVDSRVVEPKSEVAHIASYPIRYPVGRARARDVTVRVALRRPDRGGVVGIRVAVEPLRKDGVVPLNRLAKPRKRRPRRPTAPPATTVQALDAGPTLALADPVKDEPAVPPEAPVVAILGPDAGAPDAGPASPRATTTAVTTAPPPLAAVAEGRVRMTLQNDMSAVFRLEAVTLAIDGAPVDVAALTPGAKTLALFDGELAAGAHSLDVGLRYSGDGGLLFSYLDQYAFHVRDRHRFTVSDEGGIDVTIQAYEAGDFLTEIVDRPALRIRSTTRAPE